MSDAIMKHYKSFLDSVEDMIISDRSINEKLIYILADIRNELRFNKKYLKPKVSDNFDEFFAYLEDNSLN